MIRKPIVNVPKEKKAPKPLKRTLLKLSRKPIRKLGRRGVIKKAGKRDALELYFKLHGENAPCQMCDKPMIKGHPWLKPDPCHKVGAGRGKQHGVPFWGEMPENIIAAHHICHVWQTPLADAARALEASRISVLTSGVIEWPPQVEKSRMAFLQRNSHLLK